jgi:aryl-alcohol dehydrogenase-like predicted oxidoreductase
MPYGIANASGPPNEAEFDALLDVARAAGIRTIDTARAYGEAEARIGRSRVSEEGFRVITKLAPDLKREGQGLAEVLESVERSLSESRRALDLETLPTVLLHRFEHRHLGGGRVWRSLLAERDAGRIGALGVSAATPEEAWAALEDSDIEVLQVASSLLDRRLHRHGFFARARELGRTVYVRSVYLQGVAHLDPQRLPAPLAGLAVPLAQIRETARELGVEIPALFLAFVRELPGAIALLGCERAEQLERNLEDWANDQVDSAAVARLVDALPEIPEELLDPSRWPAKPAGEGNQTPAAGVATLPT